MPKKTIAKIDTLIDLTTGALQAQLYRGGTTPAHFAVGPGVTAPTLTEEEQGLYDGLMKQLGPEVQRQAEELIKTEMRDMMLMGGNWSRVKEFLKGGKRPKLVRKREGPRDPLFLQFGDGVDTEIEEFRILG